MYKCVMRRSSDFNFNVFLCLKSPQISRIVAMNWQRTCLENTTILGAKGKVPPIRTSFLPAKETRKNRLQSDRLPSSSPALESFDFYGFMWTLLDCQLYKLIQFNHATHNWFTEYLKI